MANQPPAPTPQPPPDLPADATLSTQLTQYLRTFSLWCRRGFADRLPSTTALPGILIMAKDVKSGDDPNAPHRTYLLEVTNAGGTAAITLTFVPAGQGSP